ncbi:hypothetical protein FY034_01520 [Trichlorobacter lovleyi]|uniref:hypothetical protein n=1 Tax=Trichlorobacter lovleyi TaxID=313985 RepID=UPI00223F5653|nr:hypothetical protein [Trichlorobacter lovleyi]QOX77671.1 hypothetical protein FY034_01520 [Trichlorobacter lovleyi]
MMQTLLLILLAVIVTTSASAKETYISYDVIETRRTASDHRESITQISLLPGDDINYYYREDVYGSTTPVVTAIYFQNSYKRKATEKEKKDLILKLLEANIFHLKSDPKSESKEYFTDLNVRINDRECRYFFNTPPKSPTRKAIHDIMLKFTKKTKVDQPLDRAKATTVTEGDLQPARQVQLTEILENLDKYHGKRVSVIGYYHGEFEGSSLSVDEKASKSNDLKRSIWRSEPSTFAEKSAIKDKNNAWLRVDGVFLRGPRGHMSLWPGEITRLTRVEPVSKP